MSTHSMYSFIIIICQLPWSVFSSTNSWQTQSQCEARCTEWPSKHVTSFPYKYSCAVPWTLTLPIQGRQSLLVQVRKGKGTLAYVECFCFPWKVSTLVCTNIIKAPARVQCIESITIGFLYRGLQTIVCEPVGVGCTISKGWAVGERDVRLSTFLGYVSMPVLVSKSTVTTRSFGDLRDPTLGFMILFPFTFVRWLEEWEQAPCRTATIWIAVGTVRNSLEIDF